MKIKNWLIIITLIVFNMIFDQLLSVQTAQDPVRVVKNAPLEPANITKCEASYYKNVETVLNKLRTVLPPERLKDAQTYIALVKQYNELGTQLLKMERTVFNTADVQGRMRKPYDLYVQCRDMKLVVPTVTRH